ncbi:MAG: hypothetical protein WAK29_07245 [Terriglobales bacterium]
MSETVNVDASAEMINTHDASVSTVVDRQFADNLPFEYLRIQLPPGNLSGDHPADILVRIRIKGGINPRMIQDALAGLLVLLCLAHQPLLVDILYLQGA